ncbi:MAG TPA: ATP-binding protein [Solirubrobacteraceae bacterium]|nr:ATP-binding protein [Solirubrobacteraceae bacterium]
MAVQGLVRPHRVAGSRSAQPDSNAGEATRDAGPVGWARWHPRAIVTLAAALMLVLLGVFALVLASSQARSRHDAEQRFGAQATIAAGLTKAIFSATVAPEVQAATRSYGGAHLNAGTLAALAKGTGLGYAYVADSSGHILASTAGMPASAARGVGAVAVAHALGGAPWFSDLVAGPGGHYLVEQAIPFPTKFGERVEVLGYPVTLLSKFLGSYLLDALPHQSARGYMVDGAGRILAGSASTVPIGSQLSPQFAAALSSHADDTSVQGRYGAANSGPQTYFVAASIGGSAWRVALTEPVSTLYPADVGSQWWVIWLVFVAFALAGLGCVLLLRRSLSTAGQLVAQAHQVAVVNAELEATNAELGAFSYSVSHDLRAPLRAIDGFSRIVIEDSEHTLTESQQRYLGLIRDNTRAMGDLIDDLLAFSRLASQPVTRAPVDSAALVEELERELASAEPSRAIEFTNGHLPVLAADHALVRQVFANLLGNAVKYSSTRTPSRIAVGAEQRDGELVFSVADNGVGFDMRYAEKLFQVFQRLHRAEDYEGTGVGLAIVQRIVTRHGGRIWAESTPDEGAVFHFTLEAAAL